jgi:hypothetical protein
MSFLIILLGVLLSGSLFSIGFMQFVRQRRLPGIVLVVLAAVVFVSLFFVIKDAPPIQSLE